MTVFEVFVRLATKFNDYLTNLFVSLNKNKYHQMIVPENIKNAKSGSILLIRNSLVLKEFVNYTHALMIYTHNDVQYVITAEPIPYCEVVDINIYFKTLLTNIATVDLYEIQAPYDDKIQNNINELHNFAINQIDKKPYEKSGIEFLYSKFHGNTRSDDKSFFCSELVVYIAQKYGIPVTGLPDNYAPDDLAKIPTIWKKL
jgi:hypothetical protein